MRFKLDENLGTLGKQLLESEGHDVMTIAAERLSRATDVRVYDVCCAEDRVLITLDHDFGQVLRFPPESLAGIVVLECLGRLSPKAIEARIADLRRYCARSRSSASCGLWSPAEFASINGSSDAQIGASHQ